MRQRIDAIFMLLAAVFFFGAAADYPATPTYPAQPTFPTWATSPIYADYPATAVAVTTSLVLQIDGAESGALVVSVGEATFERASAGYAWTGSALALRTTDYPRTMCQPGDAATGLCIEGQRTATAAQSEAFDSWGYANLTYTTNAGTAPNGAATAEGLKAANGTNEAHGIRNVGSAAAGVFSVFVRQVTGGTHPLPWIGVGMYDVGNLTYFNAADCTKGTTEGAWIDEAGCEMYGAWIHPWTRWTFDLAAQSPWFEMSDADATDTMTSDGVETNAYIWGAMYEAAASFPSSYIATTTSDVTRNADKLHFASSQLDNEKGTVTLSFQPHWRNAWLPDGGKYYLLDLGDVEVYAERDGANYQITATDGTNDISQAVTFTEGQAYEVSVAWGAALTLKVDSEDAVSTDYAAPEFAETGTLGCDTSYDNCLFGQLTDSVKLYDGELTL